MYKEIQIRIKPEEAAEQELLREYAAREVGVSLERIRHIDPVSYTHLTLPTICSV